MKATSTLLILTLGLVLSACGGGGSSTSTTRAATDMVRNF